MANDKIVIKGAREHNLKNIDLTLPREKFIVMTGLSGSGKSSLAFDTIYADGQRRYVESLSSYARMFLGRMDKPDVDVRVEDRIREGERMGFKRCILPQSSLEQLGGIRFDLELIGVRDIREALRAIQKES